MKNFKSDDVNEIIRELDRLSKDNKRILVLFFDEFQNIKKVNINYGSLLHDIFDWCDNTTVVVSGSIVGMMEEVLKQVEEEKPFYGRNFIRIELDKFEREKSKEFLLKGFEEEKVKIDNQTLEKALKYFDGIPGWLALFGRSYSYSVKHGSKVELKLILREASKQEAKEFTNFLKVSNSPNRYAGIILALGSLKKARLKEIRDYVSTVLKDNVRESRVKELIDTLITYGFARKISTGVYSLPEDLPTKLGLVHSAKRWIKKK
ncbi:AAA family ATPase [Acidianus manzaensis]|uniref:AAA family ATPase n=1 Tax=Acidianus manzaensis TaxID=282676 RepID=UPI0021500D3C|nr:ATP-binding protein [Acidianus manzaensis]